jgi:hypothetical protein
MPRSIHGNDELRQTQEILISNDRPKPAASIANFSRNRARRKASTIITSCDSAAGSYRALGGGAELCDEMVEPLRESRKNAFEELVRG